MGNVVLDWAYGHVAAFPQGEIVINCRVLKDGNHSLSFLNFIGELSLHL